MKAVVAAFNQEKALVGAFSVITNLRMEVFGALGSTHLYYAPLTSRKLFRVDTELLNSNQDISSSVTEVGTKPSQTDGLAMDNRGNLYMQVCLHCLLPLLLVQLTFLWTVDLRFKL